MSSIFFSVIILLVFSYFVWFLTSKHKKNLVSNPPSPPKLPILGHLHLIGPSRHRTVGSLSAKHGPIMSLQLGTIPAVVISSAGMAKEILKAHDASFVDRPLPNASKLIFRYPKDVIVSPYGDQWRKSKSLLVHELLNIKTVKSLTSIIKEETNLVVKNITNSLQAPINLTTMFLLLISDITCRSAFGKKLTETGLEKSFINAINEAVRLATNVTVGEFLPWLAWINKLNGYDSAVKKATKIWDKVIDAIIQERLESIAETTTRDQNDGNFIDICLRIYKDANQTPADVALNDIDALKALTLNILTGATETSAVLLEWAMTELIRHPTVMMKLKYEIRENMEGKESISDDDLQKMDYLKAVIKETLRYHPPLPVYTRESREDVNVMEYVIKAKTWVVINTWAIGRDPKFWDEPEKFMPERFLNSSLDFKGFDFQFIPFGVGRRSCPGITFANTSVEHILANLIHKFDWGLPNGAKVEDLDTLEKPGLSVGRKNPLIVTATKAKFDNFI